MPEVGGCPGAGQLRELLAGRLPTDTAERLELHLAGCASCARQVRRFQEEDPLAADLRRPSAAEGFEAERVADLVFRLRTLGPGKAPPRDGATAATYQTAHPEVKAVELDRFLAPPQAPDELGRLGPYRVLRVLGAGGMGIVIRAEDPQRRRVVALKVMRPEVAESPAVRERFLREARAAAAIADDHIVPIDEVGEHDGVPYLVMPLLEGESLEARLRRGPRLSMAEVLHIGRETAVGLAAAHACGLVHRDVKPANIWLESHFTAENAESARRGRQREK